MTFNIKITNWSYACVYFIAVALDELFLNVLHFPMKNIDRSLDLVTCVAYRHDVQLRNEFHFSGVHGAMNRSGSLAKLT